MTADGPPIISAVLKDAPVECQHCGADPVVVISCTVSTVSDGTTAVTGLGVLGAGCLDHVDDTFRELRAWLDGYGDGGARAFIRDELAGWS